ncbi:hypothetical protein Glove_410g13 [Diversispora epigaea]|uniref:Uncharacterized protein n=1 Tax=Diversispora epigaea TaxID=1348612 RepID=A0A397H382_9GLOM|nr:hypothetical protein Glove_410g13 [Diversispora epigaea]
MENTHFLLNELLSLSPNQTFCNKSFSFMNELTIQDVESEIENQSNKRNREEYKGGEEGEGSRKRSCKEDGEGEDAEKIKREKKRESDRKSGVCNDLNNNNKNNNNINITSLGKRKNSSSSGGGKKQKTN